MAKEIIFDIEADALLNDVTKVHCLSYTIVGEWKEVGEWMWENRENFTALSVLPYSDHSYIQAPFEDVDEETYNELIGHLHDINLDDVVEFADGTNLSGEVACGGGACEVV